MARKLRPHEELAFYEAIPSEEAAMAAEFRSALRQSRLVTSNFADLRAFDQPAVEIFWPDSSWPEKWGW